MDTHSPQPSDAPASTSTSNASPSVPPIPPLRNPKYRHVSRSAAKRESVQLLGSIRDLQLRFSNGVTLEHRAGAGLGVKGMPGLGEEDEGGGEESYEPLRMVNANSYAGGGLGESSYGRGSGRGKGVENGGGKGSNRRERRPYKEVDLPKIDLEDARSESSTLTTHICALWSSTAATAEPSGSIPLSTSNIKDAFISTAQGVRRARHLALASHAHVLANARNAHLHASNRNPNGSGTGSGGMRRSSAPITRPRAAMLSTPSRPGALPRAVSHAHPAPERKSSNGPTGTGTVADGSGRRERGAPGEEGIGWEGEDAYWTLRRAAIDVLAQMRHLEERLRLYAPVRDPATSSPRGGSSHTAPAVVVSHDQLCDSPKGMIDPAFAAASASNHSDIVNLSTGNSIDVISTRPSSALSGYSETEANAVDAAAAAGYDFEDDEYNVNAITAQAQDEEKAHVPWEERIVSEHREYRDPFEDVTGGSEEIKGVREAVERWAEVVIKLFEAATAEKEKGKGDSPWIVDDWTGRDMAFLNAQLPLNLQLLLPSPSTTTDLRTSLLSRLSDGFILIQAHNASLYTSTKPWGFIPDEDVHDTLSTSNATGSEIESAREWTFRRTENLTCWAAALRFRYNLPVHLPSSAQLTLPSLPLPGLTSPSMNNCASPNSSLNSNINAGGGASRSTSGGSSGTSSSIHAGGGGSGSGLVGKKDGSRIDFDPGLVAKREGNWDVMLSELLSAWVGAVARELVGS